jgi:hypothetical protein
MLGLEARRLALRHRKNLAIYLQVMRLEYCEMVGPLASHCLTALPRRTLRNARAGLSNTPRPTPCGVPVNYVWSIKEGRSTVHPARASVTLRQTGAYGYQANTEN